MTIIEQLLSWAQAHSGLISVAGALIIFFSWAVTNTLAQRYDRIKAGTESAQARFRLYTTLHEQRNQLNSLALEVIQRGEPGRDASIFSAGKAGDPVLNQARQQYSRDCLSAHQVTELWDFTVESKVLSQAAGKPSATSEAIAQILSKIEPIYSRLNDLERAAEGAINDPHLEPSKVMRAVQAYSDYYRSEALPEVPHLYPRIVEASNARCDEANTRVALAKTQAEWSSRSAICLYIVGSLLALSGQAIEKTKPKEALPCVMYVLPQATTPAATSSGTAQQDPQP